MRSKLRSSPFRGWLNLAVCSLAISVCFFSCTLSVDAEPSRDELQGVDRARFNPWSGPIASWSDPGAGG
ncbi:MAG: hypothetical protein IT336_06565 [Thermomicrobiales bacterium]|nr:hypothetical protein [Thermomicrobiales bacterium]